LDDIEEEDLNPGVVRMIDADIPSAEDYGDMLVEERPEEDDEEAVDKYLNVELIMNAGTIFLIGMVERPLSKTCGYLKNKLSIIRQASLTG
jgi:hypothetical protein